MRERKPPPTNPSEAVFLFIFVALPPSPIESCMKSSPRLERILQRVENRPVITLILWGVVLLLPMLILGASLTAHDSFHHMVSILSFADQIGSGDLYPRWI